MLLTINETTDDGCGGCSFSCVVSKKDWESSERRILSRLLSPIVVNTQTGIVVWSYLGGTESSAFDVFSREFKGTALPVENGDAESIRFAENILARLSDERGDSTAL